MKALKLLTIILLVGISASCQRGIDLPGGAKLRLGHGNTADIFINIIGQSNALGRADTLEITDLDELGEQDSIYMWNRATNVYETYWPGRTGNNNSGDFGVELFLGRLLRSHYPGRRIVFHKFAVGGTQLDTSSTAQDWNLASSGDLWAQGKTTLGRAIDSASSVNGWDIDYMAMIWWQGETDADVLSRANRYESNEADIFADMRSVYGSSLKIIDVKIVTSRTYSATVNTAKLSNQTANSNNIVIDNTGWSYPDNLHVDADGLRSAATAIFNVIKNYWK